MIKENQLIKLIWGHINKKRYQNKGYQFTEYGDSFYVSVNDLPEKSDKSIEFICDQCGKLYHRVMYLETKYRKRFNGLNLCNSCIRKNKYKNELKDRAKEAFKIIKQWAKINDYKVLTTEDEYTGNVMDIKFICKKHGYQSVKLVNLKQGCGCRDCGYEKVANFNKLDSKEVEKQINSINGNILLNPDEYVNDSTRNLKILCGTCGKNIFITSHNSYIGGVNKCRSCSSKVSVGEQKLYSILEKHDIDYEDQKTFEDCKDLMLLPFDAYLPDFNTCIEFDGMQHFEPIFGEDKLKYTQKHDEIKTNYCIRNNINLIRIPYFKSQEMEDILIQKLHI